MVVEAESRTATNRAAKVAYGAAFCIALPALLVLWARLTSDWVKLPVPRGATATGLGLAAAALGLGLAAAAMLDLYRRGGGLPMNAFPPKRLVTTGVYRWFGQPIYLGAVLCAAGLSVAAGSASGLWLVTPTLALGAATLTFGYERHDLQRRFGARAQPLFGLPSDTAEAPTGAERFGTAALVLGLWLALFAATTYLPVPVDGISLYFDAELRWQLLPWTEGLYASAYLAVPLAFFLPRSRRALRDFGAAGLWATGLIGLLWWTLPFVAPPRSLDGVEPGFWLEAMRLERSYDDAAGVGAFPSFHVCWAFLAASVWRLRIGAPAAYGWAVLVAVSCVTTGMHAVVDVIAGALVFVAVQGRAWIWERIRRGSERLANSWMEWRVGPVRIINHGFFGATGALAGSLIVMALLGDGGIVDLWVLGLTSVVTAGLWAQIIEGESVSLRPFGYYGAVVGFVLGGGVLAAAGRDPVDPWAAFAVASPWIQAFGRCRCLIQGCCHGQPSSPAAGISVVHPRSRVVRLAGLGGRPVYPTQTYSILCNVVSGLALYRLWSVGVPAPALVGFYLMFAGAGRFVEEAFRGEPQTPRVFGLPIYQWNATISFAAGIAFTAWPGASLPASPGLSTQGILSAAALAVIVGCLMGIDFPESRRRFGRLTK